MRNTKFKRNLLFSSLISVFVLSACGGSSGGSATPAPLNDGAANTNNDGNGGGNAQNPSADGIPAPIELNIDSADTGSNALMYANANNNARLTGPVFGTGELVSSEAVEKLALYGPSGGAAGLTVVGAYAGIEQGRGINTTMIIAMQNTSSLLQCGQIVEAKVVQTDGSLYSTRSNGNPENYWIDADGSAYNTIDINGNPSVDEDCVPPGSIVYGHVDIQESFSSDGLAFGSAAGITGGVSFARPYSVDREVSSPIVPLSYTVGEDGKIQVLIENQDGAQAYEVSIEGYALSEQGWPMAHFVGYDELVLQPGESGELPLESADFTGSASAIRVFVEREYCGVDAGYAPDC